MLFGKKGLPEFHPQTVLRDWGNGEAFRLSDAQTGVCVFGATGSGKTSGPAKHLAYGYLAAGFGGLVLCAKKEECRQWQQWAADTRRTKDLIIIDGGGQWRFNFLEWEASRPDVGGGLTINIVSILDEIAGAIASSASGAEGGQGDNKFWDDALHHMNTNLVDLPIFAGLRVSLPLMRSIVTTAPQSLAQLEDPAWQESSACAAIIREGDKATQKASADTHGVRWHTFCVGISYLELIPWPPIIASHRRVYRYIEPVACFLVGLLVSGIISRPLGIWIMFSSLALSVFEQTLFEKHLERDLDILDGLISAEVQGETAKFFDGPQPGEKQRTLEDTAGIPTGVAPDIHRQVEIRRAKLAKAPPDNLVAETPEAAG